MTKCILLAPTVSQAPHSSQHLGLGRFTRQSTREKPVAERTLAKSYELLQAVLCLLKRCLSCLANNQSQIYKSQRQVLTNILTLLPLTPQLESEGLLDSKTVFQNRAREFLNALSEFLQGVQTFDVEPSPLVNCWLGVSFEHPNDYAKFRTKGYWVGVPKDQTPITSNKEKQPSLKMREALHARWVRCAGRAMTYVNSWALHDLDVI